MAEFVELFLSMIDLVKAELTQSKLGLMRGLSAMLLLVMGFLFLLTALALVLYSVYLALRLALPLPVAALLTGFTSLMIAGLLLWISSLKIRR